VRIGDELLSSLQQNQIKLWRDEARRWAPGGVKAHAVSQLFDSLDILVGLYVLDGVQALLPLFLLKIPSPILDGLPAPNAICENLVGG